MNIKPIETQYKGYRFRSRLEARWAVFFDTLGYEWVYEKEGYQLDGYKMATADFVERHRWPNCTLEELEMMTDVAGMMADLAAQDLYYLPDFWLPARQVWAEIKPQNDKGKPKLEMQDIEKIFRLVNRTNCPCWICTDFSSDIQVIKPGDPTNNLAELQTLSPNLQDAEIIKAIYAARGARFEHGERPA